MFQTRVFGTIYYLPAAATLVLLTAWIWSPSLIYLVHIATGLCVALPITIAGRALSGVLRKGLLPTGSLLSCLLLWAALTLAILPHSYLLQDRGLSPMLVCVFLAAFPLIPALRMLNESQWRSADNTAPTENRRNVSPKRTIGFFVALTLLLCTAAVRWVTEPAFKAAWRAKGLPTDLQESAIYIRVCDTSFGVAWTTLYTGSLEAVLT